ncbi:MAG: phosphopantetheine-binding protein [Actinomycetota bacterium]
MSIDSPTPTPAVVDAAFADELLGFIVDEVSAIDDPLETSSDLLLTGAVDSMGVVLVVQWIEDRLSITIDPADVVIEHFISVDAMVDYLRGRLG